MTKEAGISESIARWAKKLIWIAVAAHAILLGLYFYKFARGEFFLKLADNSSVWADLGTFYGGLLGPFLSFLAFLGVLVTVVLQGRQLDIAKQQALFEELQRTLSSMADRVDGLQDGPNTRVVGVAYLEWWEDVHSIYSLVSKVGVAHLNHLHAKSGEYESAWDEGDLKKLAQVVSETCTLLIKEIETLAWCISRYGEIGGSSVVVRFYLHRYRWLVLCLEATGLLSGMDDTRRCFGSEAELKRVVANGPIPNPLLNALP